MLCLNILKKCVIISLVFGFSFLFFDCSKRLEPDPLPLSVRQNLALLQTDPQFVMYFNFKKMRESDFWKKFISDSLFQAEKNFGNFLFTLKQATGVSISDGIDELYYSNSWFGDNAIVVRGVFDKKKVEDYVKSDTFYQKLSYPDNIIVFKQTEINFYFYFKDDFTVCASNYLKMIENTMNIRDTSVAGLLTNTDAMKVIENVKHKENLWIMSNQKLFIKGIFENFTEMNKPDDKLPEISGMDSLTKEDTTSTKDEKFDLASVYKKIAAVSFSIKMSDELEIIMQNECESDKAAEELKNKLEGLTALIKLSTSLSQKKPSAVINLLDDLKFSAYDKTTLVQVKLDEKKINEIRKQKVF